MRNILTIVIAMMISSQTLAQSADHLLIRVNYTLIKKNDTLPTGKQRKENMLLFVGKNASLFTSYDKLRHEVSEDQKFRTKLLAGSAPKVSIIDETGTAKMSKVDYFYFTNQHTLATKEVLALQPYIILEKMPKIDWKITKDTASFFGISCFKATATFEGRPWIAWFSPTYPFQTGPWKLNSLPGLIIEAYDESKSIYFQFSGIENAKEGDFQRSYDVTKRVDARPGDFNPVDQLIGRDVAAAFYENIIKLPVNGVRTDRKEFEKLKEAFIKDPKGFVKAQARY